MLIRDFDIFGSVLRPHKANPKLIIDANTMLPFAFALQGFKPIAGAPLQTREITPIHTS